MEHRLNSATNPPPREAPTALLKLKETYSLWLKLHRNFPKTERFGLGQKIDNFFLDSLELIFASIYLPPEQKMPLLAKAIAKIDAVKFFVQIVWENKLIAAEQYSELIMKLQEIGRMLGGWRKGLINKTPECPKQSGEKQ